MPLECEQFPAGLRIPQLYGAVIGTAGQPLKDTLLTAELCPLHVNMSWPVWASHTLSSGRALARRLACVRNGSSCRLSALQISQIISALDGLKQSTVRSLEYLKCLLCLFQREQRQTAPRQKTKCFPTT